MSRPKPRIRKAVDGWRVERPRAGFGGTETLGPFDSHAAAVAALQPKTASASSSMTAGPQPHASQWRWHGHRYYPMKIQ